MTQKEALEILKLGHNVFLTGPAGSGKTYLLNQYIQYLKEHKVAVGITASTGIAATHMGGVTIHSWAGMGIKDSMDDREIAELLKRPYLRNRFRSAKVLIIDEISMLHSYRLDLIDRICRAFKRTPYPFGGMQVVMCGDFFQLPPIVREKREEIRVKSERDPMINGNKNQQDMAFANKRNVIASEVWQSQEIHTSALGSPQNDNKAPFVYQSDIWKDMHLKVCYLDEQHRQDDRIFLRILNDIRNNEVNEMTVEYLSERINKDVKGYSKPTRLFTHNADVDAINKTHLDALPGEEHEYFMVSRGSINVMEALRKSCMAPEKLVLKIGAQVMFVKNNFEAGYVNGTLGEVIGFEEKDGSSYGASPKIRTFDGSEIVVGQASWEVKEDDMELASIAQIPLRLAWAITIHKSQGMSLDAAEVDLSRSFIPGMGYVALSRVRNLSGLKLMGMNQMALQINPDVSEIDREFILQSHEAAKLLHALTPEKKQQLQEEYLKYIKAE